MLTDRPRLKAVALCGVLVVLLGFLLFMPGRDGREMRPLEVALLRSPESQASYDVVSEPPPPEESPRVESGGNVITVAVPRIAYTYGYSFRLAAESVAAVQERHLALCRGLGPARCRVTSMRRGGQREQAAAELNLQVAAGVADAFGRRLAFISAGAGGETIDRAITAEDLSRQMIDGEARIRTREILIRRLTALLETRSGNIQQAVEAERAINTAQEELEAARAWLGEMRTRVAMSAVEIDYLVAAPPVAGSESPIAEAFATVGAGATASLGAFILVVGIAFPWLLLGLLVWLAMQVMKKRGLLFSTSLVD